MLESRIPMIDAVRADQITRLIAEFREGNMAAANQLVELLYPELRRMAAAKMRGERSEHSWQPTILVNELYLAIYRTSGLAGKRGGDHEKAAFLALAGLIMKRLLIDHARPLYRRAEKVEYQDTPDPQNAESLHFVEETLQRLGAIDPKLRAVVEMRVFEGLTGEQIAHQLRCSSRSVASYWAFARRWLQKELA